MTRINTNVSALIAEQNLNNSNSQLQTTLTRLSTGLRINSAADDPAGMIAATDLGSNIAASNQAISNSQVASQMISTADSALSQISSLLTTINGLVTQAANTSAESSSQIAANQLQIDSSLNAINSIAQTTNFQGQNLLDGSLGFLTQGVSSNYASTVQNLQVNQVTFGANNSPVQVNVNVTAAATQAQVTDNIPSTTGSVATLALTGGSIQVTAPAGNSAYNNAAIKVVSNNSVTSAAPTAVWTPSSTTNGVTTPGTLTVTVASTGTTSAAAIASAITAAGFTVAAGASGNFIAGTTQASANATTATPISIGGGTLTITASSLSSALNGTNVVFNTSGTSATPSAAYTAGTNGGAGTLTITVDGGQTTTLTAIADAINNSTDPNVQQFSATVGGTTGAVLDPTQDSPTGVAATAASGTVDIGGPAGSGGIGLVVTAKATGTAGNGLEINVVEGQGAGAPTATYDSTANGGNGLLTLTLGNGVAVTQTEIATALTGVTNAHAAFATSFNYSFTANSATSINTPNTADTQTATAATATTSGGSSDSVTAQVADSSAATPNLAAFTLTANTPGAGPSSVELSVAHGATTGATYNNGILAITLATGFTGSATQLAALQAAFAQTAIGSTFTLGTNIQSAYSEAGTGTTATATLDNTPVAATTGAIAYAGDTAGSANFTVTATNPGTAGNGLNVVIQGGTTTGAVLSAGTLTLTLASGFTASAAQMAALNQDIALTGAQYTVSATTSGGFTTDGLEAATALTPTANGYAPSPNAYDTGTATINDGTNAIQVTATANAFGAKPPVTISVTEGGAGTTNTTATYTAATNTLAITLAYNAQVTTNDLTQALSSANLGSGSAGDAAAFLANYNLTVSGVNGATSIQTADTASLNNAISAYGTTAGGHAATPALNTTLSGAGVSGQFNTATAGGLTGALVIEIAGSAGNQQLSFTTGTTAAQIADAINQVSDSTNVAASVDATTGALTLNSTDYGSAAYVNVTVVNDAGTFASNLSATHATGSDIQATVNNVAAIGSGNTVSLNSPNLSFAATLTPGVTAGTGVQFEINGGGALFQLGAVVTSSQQARLGIQNVDTSSLGGTVGRLYEIGSGQDASLTANPEKAGQIVQAALNNITSLRGQLGAFQTSTIDTNISTLTNAVTNLTAAQSSIQDADFAAESANLSREQILVQSGTTVAGIASSTPANVLSLLQKAAQV